MADTAPTFLDATSPTNGRGKVSFATTNTPSITTPITPLGVVVGDDVALNQWYKRALKKGPYYLLRKEPFRNYCYDLPDALKRWPGIDDWQKYWLIWREKTKTKLAIVEDGFSARYGFNTLGVLTGTSVTGLWQASVNSVNEEQLKALLDVANGRITLPEFDIRTLKDVGW